MYMILTLGLGVSKYGAHCEGVDIGPTNLTDAAPVAVETHLHSPFVWINTAGQSNISIGTTGVACWSKEEEEEERENELKKRSSFINSTAYDCLAKAFMLLLILCDAGRNDGT